MLSGEDRSPFVLDVTLRDGGYLNDHSWTLEQASAIVSRLAEAGVRNIEVGYLAAGPAQAARPSATCDDRYLTHLARLARERDLRLLAMARPGIALPEDLDRLVAHGIAGVRVPASADSLADALPLVIGARQRELAVAVNLTRASEHAPSALAAAGAAAASAGAQLIYLADSNGSLLPDGVRERMRAMSESCDAPLGFHAHDNLGLAFANALAAAASGASALDASIAGIGKGGGNLGLEQISAYLAAREGVPVRLEPLLAARTIVSSEIEARGAQAVVAMVRGFLDVNIDNTAEFDSRISVEGIDAVVRHWNRAGAHPPVSVPGA